MTKSHQLFRFAVLFYLVLAAAPSSPWATDAGAHLDAARLAEAGTHLWGLGMYEKAATLLGMAHEQTPHEVKTGVYLIETLKKSDGEALQSLIDTWKGKLAGEDDDRTLQFLIGHGSLKEKKYDEAYKALKKAEALGLESPYLVLDLAFLKGLARDRKGVEAILDGMPEGLSEDPLIAITRHSLITRAYRRPGKKELKYESDFRLALAHHPECAAAWAGLGRLLDKKNRDKEASRCFETAQQLAPDDHDILHAYHEFLWNNGKLEKYAKTLVEHLSGCGSCRQGGPSSMEKLASAGKRDLALMMAKDAKQEKESRNLSRLIAKTEREISFYRQRKTEEEALVFLEGDEAKKKVLKNRVSPLPRFVLIEKAGSEWNARFMSEVLDDSDMREHFAQCLLFRITVEDGEDPALVQPIVGEDRDLQLPTAVLLGPTGIPLTVLARDIRPDKAASELKKGIESFSKMDVETLISGGEPKWIAGIEKALVRAKQDAKDMAVLFTKQDNIWCSRLEEEAFSDPAVSAMLSTFVPVRVTDGGEAGRHSVDVYPTLLFLNHNGQVEYRASGYRDPEILLRDFTALRESKEKKKKAEKGTGIGWLHDFDHALALAKQEQKHLLIDVYTDWCHWCHVLEEKTFPDPKVIEAIQRGFIPLKTNPEVEEASRDRFMVSGFPTTLILSPEGFEIKRFAGYLPPEAYLEQLELDESLKALKTTGAEKYRTVLRKLREIERYAYVMPETAAEKVKHLHDLPPDDSNVSNLWVRIAQGRARNNDHEGMLEALKHLAVHGKGTDPDTYAYLMSGLELGDEKLKTFGDEVGKISGKAKAVKGADLLAGFSKFLATKNKLDDAISAAKRAAGLASRHSEAWRNLAVVHILRGEYGDAARATNKAKRYGKTQRELPVLRALIYRLEGERGKAEEILSMLKNEKALEGPSYMLAEIAKRFEANDKAEEAAAALWAAATLAPDDANAQNRYGWALLEAGTDSDEARTVLQSAVSLIDDRKKGANIWDSLAWAHYRKGDLLPAFEAISESIRRTGGVTQNDETRYHLGVILAGLGLDRQAEEELKAVAAEAEPEEKDTSIKAQAYRELEKLKKKTAN